MRDVQEKPVGAVTWYRVHFRTKQILVDGEAALERVKRRKVPKVILVEEMPEHTCSTCGKVDAWLDGWCWYGSYNDLDEGNPVPKYCSTECRPARTEKRRARGDDWRQHPDTNRHEPREERFERWREIDQAKRDANPRLFPMPVWPKERCRNGWCKWCGEEIIDRTGKNKGKRSYRRTTHRHSYGDDRDCAHEWALHTHLDTQRAYLAARDGDRCAICPPDAGHWEDAGPFPAYMRVTGNWIRWSHELEVDHIVELWEVAHLPPDERRFYFGPENLWLLCKNRCHKMKSKEAASRRAAAR